MAARSKPFCLWTSRWELCASLALSLSRDSVRGIAAHVRLCHFCTGTVKASGEIAKVHVRQSGHGRPVQLGVLT